jgi:sugar phosphate isomerase/epimerase
LNYVLASPLYGTTLLAEVLPEVHKTGATALDIWPRRHADHREQVDAMGHERFLELLQASGVKLGVITRFDLGPYRLREEMDVLRKLGGRMLVTGAEATAGDTLRQKVWNFVESLKPHVETAAESGLTIAIENHASLLIDSADAIRYFAEFAPAEHLGLALAPYHLPQDPALLAGLISDLGPKLALFYAWQHGNGCMSSQPKEQELLQLPGRGQLDFGPLLAALKKINYSGWTEIFMHPFPRGISILESTERVTAAVNESRQYLDRLAAGLGC